MRREVRRASRTTSARSGAGDTVAGAARSRLALFLLALTLGHLLWNTVTQYLGDALAQRTELLTAFLGEHLVESTLVCVALVVLQQLISRWRRAPQPAP